MDGSKLRAVFLEGSAPALPKNSAHQEMRPPVFSSFSVSPLSSPLLHLSVSLINS
jgi:hypothetical protein